MGDIIYDYPVIEQCVDMMGKKANEILHQTDDLEKDVKRIMTDWQGSTAEAYNRLCSDLDSDLRQNVDNLNNLNKTLHEAADRMRQQDNQGGNRIH